MVHLSEVQEVIHSDDLDLAGLDRNVPHGTVTIRIPQQLVRIMAQALGKIDASHAMNTITGTEYTLGHSRKLWSITHTTLLRGVGRSLHRV